LKKTIVLVSLLFVLVLAASAAQAAFPGLGDVLPEYNMDSNIISPEVAVAPIPGTAMLFGSALVSLVGLRRLLRRS
jgi:hypothetical protein